MFSALALRHGALKRVADITLIRNAFTLCILAHGVEQLVGYSQIERFLLWLELEMHRLELREIKIGKILFEKCLGLFISLEYRDFPFHSLRSPCRACNGR